MNTYIFYLLDIRFTFTLQKLPLNESTKLVKLVINATKFIQLNLDCIYYDLLNMNSINTNAKAYELKFNTSINKNDI